MKRRTLTALIAALILPLFAAAVAIGAVSDRPENINQVPAAIVNFDEGTEMEINGKTQFVPFGRLISAELVAPTDAEAKRDTLKWELVSEKRATKGLADGEYYAVVTIPADFSKQVATLGTKDAQIARISVQSNDASSALMGRLSRAIARAVAAEVGEELTAQLLEQIYLGFDEVAAGLDEAASGAGELEAGAGELADGTHQAADGANQLAGNLPRLATGAGELASGANRLADGANTAASGVDRLATGADALAAGQRQLAGGANELAAGQHRLASGAAQLAAGTSAIRAEIDSMPPEVLALLRGEVDLRELDELLQIIEPLPGQIDALIDPDQAAEQLRATLQALHDARPQLQFAAKQAKAAAGQMQQVADLLAAFAADSSAADLEQLRDGLLALADGRLSELAAQCPESGASEEFCAELSQQVEALRAFANSQAMQDLLAKLTDYAAQLDGGAKTLLAILNGDGSAENPGLIAALNAISDKLIGPDGNGGLLGELEAVVQTLQATVDQLGGPDGVVAALGKIRAALIGAGGNDSLFATLRTALPKLPEFYQAMLALESGTNQLAAGSAEAAGGADALARGAGALVAGGNQLAAGSHAAANGLWQLHGGANQLAGGAGALHDGANQAVRGAGDLASGLAQLADGSTSLHDGSMSLADGLQSAADQVPRYSDAEQARMVQMGANPVAVDDSQLHKLAGARAHTFASFAPLMLWLGAIATFLVLPALPRKARTAAMSTRQATWRGYLPAAAIGAGQGLLVGLLAWIWHLSPIHPLGLIAALIIMGAGFAALVQMLQVIFGARMGTVIALLAFVVQAVTLGGLVPLQTAPAAIQSLWGALPVGGGTRALQATLLPGVGGYLPGVIIIVAWALLAVVATTVAIGRRQTITPTELRAQLRAQHELV